MIVGSTVSLLLFTTLWWTISVIFKKKGQQKPVQTLIAVMVFVLKLPLVGIGLYFIFRYVAINLFALIGGIAVTQIAIVCVAISNLFRRGART